MITLSAACQLYGKPKATLLRWLTKAGVEPVIRGCLGHHEISHSYYEADLVESVVHPKVHASAKLWTIGELADRYGMPRSRVKTRLAQIPAREHKGNTSARRWYLRDVHKILSRPLRLGSSSTMRTLWADAHQALLNDPMIMVRIAEDARELIDLGYLDYLDGATPEESAS